MAEGNRKGKDRKKERARKKEIARERKELDGCENCGQ